MIERILQTPQGHTLEEPKESISLGWDEVGARLPCVADVAEATSSQGDPGERQGNKFMRFLWAQSLLQGLGKGCLSRARLKGGLEGKGRNQQPSVPWPRAKRWCVCRLHPSHLPATLKPNYSRLMSARLGPATRCSQIPSPRARITPACTIGVGFVGRPGRREPRAGTVSPTWRLLHASPVPARHRSHGLWGGRVAVEEPWVLLRRRRAPRALLALQAGCCRCRPPWARRWAGAPRCPTERPQAPGVTWECRRKARAKGENWADPFFPSPFTCSQIFIRLFSCRAKCFFIVPSKAKLLPDLGCGSSSCIPSPRAAREGLGAFQGAWQEAGFGTR